MRLRILLAALVVCLFTAAIYWSNLLRSPDASLFFARRVPARGPGLISEGPALGEIAPGFELNSVQGKSHRLSDYRGRPVVLALGSYT